MTQYFIYDGDRIIQELNGAGNLVAAWDYGAYIDEILAMHRDTNNDGTLDTTYYYLQDDLYNVVALTNASGAVVERYSYNDYGMPSISSGSASAFGNPFMFQGRRWDSYLQLYDYRTRYYDPKIGRFLRIDTIGLWGDANNVGNPYAFVGNNPWSNLDPFGKSALGKLLRKAITESSEAGIKHKVRQEIRDNWYGYITKKISQSGLKGAFQGHHIIPQALFERPVLTKWLSEIGILKDGSKNVTVLPTRKSMQSGDYVGNAALHQGSHVN